MRSEPNNEALLILRVIEFALAVLALSVLGRCWVYGWLRAAPACSSGFDMEVDAGSPKRLR